MKNFNRILALIIALASIISVFSVFTFAAEGDEGAGDTVVENFVPSDHLIYSRTYDEGWDALNGFSHTLSGHTASIDYEVGDDFNYNYFMRLEHAGNAKELKLQLNLEARKMIQRSGKVVVSLSLMADDLCDVGNILWLNLYQEGTTNIPLLRISGYDLYAFDEAPANHIASLEDGAWVDVDLVVDWADTSKLFITAYANGEKVSEFTRPNLKPENVGVAKVNLGWMASGAGVNKAGMSICVDNLAFYQAPTLQGPKDVSGMGNGIFINTALDKTVPIYKNDSEKSPEQLLAEALFMKLGVNKALFGNERVEIDAAPVRLGDTVMAPLTDVLAYLDYPYYPHPDGRSYDINLPTGKTTYLTMNLAEAEVEGELVKLSTPPVSIEGTPFIALADVEALFPGWRGVYDNMGLVVVHEISAKNPDEVIVSRADGLDSILNKMKQFVFDVENGNLDANYKETGKSVYDAALESSEFLHPYIIADQDKFDALNAVYAADADTALKGYLTTLVEKADAIYDYRAEVVGGEYAGIQEGDEKGRGNKMPVNVYNDSSNPIATDPEDVRVKDTSDGYNPTTSALYEIETFTQELVDLAFAYQITRDERYAALAYDMMVVIGEWVHWGPGYMPNCATATGNFAIAYDWLYNVIKANAGDTAVAELATVIYEKGLSQAIRSSMGEFCNFPRTSGYGDHYITRTDSYNAICTSGMLIGALAIMGEEGYAYVESADNTDYDSICYLVGNNLRNLADYGLDQYAPDGSYIESVSYWALGTNAFMKLIMALQSSTGDDLGFKDAWGIDQTFYFACYIANADGEAWGYHETGLGSIIDGDVLTVDTQMFNYAGALLGDNKLIAIRQNQVAEGKGITMFDVLFYPDGTVEADTTLELDYYMDSLDAFVSRSAWEKDAMFVGIMGGANSYSPYGNGDADEVFGQIDSGNFIYENLGVKWAVDLGSDYYYADKYFGDYRYQFYRNSAEGNNTLFLPDDESLGQRRAGNGDMYETYIDPDGKGAYAIIDNGSCYSTAYLSSAFRGMLVTNDRKTVVIQDEIARPSVGGAMWVMNTYEEIIIDDLGGGKTAYLIHYNEDGSRIILRASLVSSFEGIRFETRSADEAIVSMTKLENTKIELGELNRLVIDAQQIVALSFAVVFEIVDSTQSDLEIGYTFTNTADWENYFNKSTDEDIVSDEYDNLTSSFGPNMSKAQYVYDSYMHFTTGLNDFYSVLCHSAYIISYNGEEAVKSVVNANIYSNYEKYLKEYNEYRTIIVGRSGELQTLTGKLSGK
ncbi:MAG: hypothetical protein IJD51_03905 [Clostridia bacterium]|nr:hypothetical protein [Clostridia bacterium]